MLTKRRSYQWPAFFFFSFRLFKSAPFGGDSTEPPPRRRSILFSYCFLFYSWCNNDESLLYGLETKKKRGGELITHQKTSETMKGVAKCNHSTTQGLISFQYCKTRIDNWFIIFVFSLWS
ncbi:hypothetical protein DM01DRAFT_1169886 [Hesseltinella vesiculosa]|uniref:Uncharacterized protein n=1 Tax=Hesseltinella vesiculosa TaxID=101127 RepID=A0A1X2G5N0_9FUNG|nr:hypothetical protein DM01DRAFT_1169886 [Hesseltinella vesiculosa]